MMKGKKKRAMINKKNILVFPCGSEIGLEINRALVNDIHFNIYGASSLPDHGRFVYKNYIEGIPFVDEDNFIIELNKVCKKYNIDYIFPAHDSVVLKLSQYKKELSAQVITSPVETCEIARSKKKTYIALNNVVPISTVYNITDNNIKFPVFIKPDVGQGSKGAKKCNNIEELNSAYKENPHIIISEYLPGNEYTIDCFTDYKGELLFAKGRIRARISNGISVNSKPINNPKFFDIANKINKKLKFRGMWFFQVKENVDGELTLIELAPRIAGTMGMYRCLGINFALLALYDAMKIDVQIINNDFDIEIDRALFARYKHNIEYDNIYIDFDDTIICNNLVNADILKFLYQAKNKNKNIILLTKHNKNIKETLSQFCISEKLFDNIIHLTKSDDKADYINLPKSIFIDDSYSERKNISVKSGIPVFGIDAIETLIDYRS